MIVEQISVFVENKKGRLNEIAEVLAKNNVDISALSLADTEEYGVVRMIVNNPYLAKEVLKENGVIAKVTSVLAVAIDDAPGGFYRALSTLAEKDISVKYMYASMSHEKGKAIMILSVDDLDKAEEIIKSSSASVAEPSEIYRLGGKN